ncbi:hypothetical protein [Candidatus Poriferisodalis sp.]|uniref:hypothetical protein n=1 Tax=Candidatus Poriferisodalis sp. TaxID=3101277 RepID=UPI003C6F572B
MTWANETGQHPITGFRLPDVCVDGSVHKAPSGGEGTGKSPVDGRKLGWKWSVATDAAGIPVGWAAAGANRNDIMLFEPTMAGLERLGGWSAIGVWCVLFVERARLSGRWFGVGWARVFCLMMPRRIVGRPVGAGVAGRGGCFT